MDEPLSFSDGRYSDLAVLARGEFGDVYEASDRGDAPTDVELRLKM